MSTKITTADLIRALLAAGYQRAESTLRKKSVAELEALLADWTCGGCDNGEHCGACECCEQLVEALSKADEPVQAESTTEPAEQPEKADYVVSWRGNYNTAFAPAAELLATSTTLVWTVNVSTMLKETHIAGPETDVIAQSADVVVSRKTADWPEPSPELRTMGSRLCPQCPARFFTSGGLAEHMTDAHPKPNPACRHRYNWTAKGAASMSRSGRRTAAQVNALRRRWDRCGKVSTPAGIGLHQKYSGHSGWTAA